MNYRKLLPLLSVSAIFFLTGCKQNEEVSNFFLMFIFMFAMAFSGIPAIVFSAISIKTTKTALYVLATVFSVFYILVSIAMLPMYEEAGRYATNSTAFLFMVVHYGGLLVSVVLTVLGYINRARGNVNKTSVPSGKTEEEELEFLDKLIDEEDNEK